MEKEESEEEEDDNDLNVMLLSFWREEYQKGNS